MRMTALYSALVDHFGVIAGGLVMVMIGCASDARLDETTLFPTANQINIEWEVLNDAVSGDDKRTVQFTIQNASDTVISRDGWALYFNQFPHSLYLDQASEKEFTVESKGGDLYAILPQDSFPGIRSGESYTFRYQTNFNVFRSSFTPKGAFFRIDAGRRIVDLGDPIPKTFSKDFSFQHPGGTKPIFKNIEDRYEEQEDLRLLDRADIQDVIPSPDYSRRKGGFFTLHSSVNIYHDEGLDEEARYLGEQLNQLLGAPSRYSTSAADTASIFLRQGALEIGERSEEVYSLDIDEKEINLIGSDRAGVFYGVQSLLALIDPQVLDQTSDSIVIPTTLLEDRPRFAYRGLHFDVARNFNGVAQLYDVIRLMSRYKLNRLHLHLTDDEGWRLEIPGLPELTEVGAKRGMQADVPSLPPAYGSGGMTTNMPGSGYISREQFIELLEYANSRHVTVIPEINGPGHARAAIWAMQARHDRLMEAGQEAQAREYLLHDPNDKSVYSSAQAYHDNVVCVCQEYTYTFFEKVMREVKKMYEEADAPLRLMHTGSDEVPHGAWTASPECEKLMAREENLHSVHDLHPYFLSRLHAILEDLDLQLGGWEEIALKTVELNGQVSYRPNLEFLDADFVPFVWNSIVGSRGEDLGYQLANSGYAVVLCNATNLYLDMAYTYEPDEPGLSWAGFVNTKNVFEYTPLDLFQTIFEDDHGNPLDGIALSKSKTRLLPEAEERILGIQGALWSETLRSPQLVEYMLLPKLLALSERAWAVQPPWRAYADGGAIQSSVNDAWNAFANRLGQVEFARLDKIENGLAYRLPPPGAKFINGMLHVNTAFPGTTVRYTVDGSEPNPYSPIYEEPIKMKSNKTIRLRSFNTTNRASRMVEVNAPMLN
ncbi:MAG: carbohydate-binding domain-containing protein [Saprospiraceae bacterium]|nr:carbohydate-binding domain-containing protein [Saprospiraceae bacterium]